MSYIGGLSTEFNHCIDQDLKKYEHMPPNVQNMGIRGAAKIAQGNV